jgi:hypothetical protein
MRSMQQRLEILGTISAFALKHRETKKNLCRGGRSQDLPDTEQLKFLRGFEAGVYRTSCTAITANS